MISILCFSHFAHLTFSSFLTFYGFAILCILLFLMFYVVITIRPYCNYTERGMICVVVLPSLSRSVLARVRINVLDVGEKTQERRYLIQLSFSPL